MERDVMRLGRDTRLASDSSASEWLLPRWAAGLRMPCGMGLNLFIEGR